MKLNKKGFTLVELLAVVVILMAISAMAISSISAAIERNKNNQDEAKKRVIVSNAELYYQENKNTLPASGCISINSLGLTDDEKKNSNGETFTGGVYYSKNATTGNVTFEYKSPCP